MMMMMTKWPKSDPSLTQNTQTDLNKIMYSLPRNGNLLAIQLRWCFQWM